MPLGRRAVLLGGGAALVGAAAPLSRLFGRPRGGRSGRYGPLTPDPAGILDLPAGFECRVVQRMGERMTDGYRVPGCFDGMACFPGAKGTLVLMRNHENSWFAPSGPYHAGQPAPSEAYDPKALGGVTRVVLRKEDLSVVSSNLALAGTLRNCAGGPSPWGFLSCEETTDERHGYVFLCPIDSERVSPANRIDGYGRFCHEAASVDPKTLVAYLTEDREDGCLYRFVPNGTATPFEGRLEALAVPGRPRLDTGIGLAVGAAFDVEWVPVADPTPPADTVRKEAHARGAAIFRRGEGIWFDSGRVFFSATIGGPRGAGQIFRLTTGDARGALRLVAQSNDTDVLDMPDNVTVAPWGDVVIAEDSIAGDQFLRVLAPDGSLSDLARNARSQSELAGACFSPDGSTLFVNLYGDGMTLAIRGPFRTA